VGAAASLGRASARNFRAPSWKAPSSSSVFDRALSFAACASLSARTSASSERARAAFGMNVFNAATKSYCGGNGTESP
jgi:hypothetical protein